MGYTCVRDWVQVGENVTARQTLRRRGFFAFLRRAKRYAVAGFFAGVARRRNVPLPGDDGRRKTLPRRVFFNDTFTIYKTLPRRA